MMDHLITLIAVVLSNTVVIASEIRLRKIEQNLNSENDQLKERILFLENAIREDKRVVVWR